MIAPRGGPIGAILAGGIGRRIGGAKALAKLRGRPLIEYPLDALRSVLDEVVVIAKPDTELPELPGVTVWIEPPEPRHPLTGITEALSRAEGRSVLVCATDLPFVSADVIQALVSHQASDAPAVVAAHDGEIQPLLGCYHPAAEELLRDAAAQGRVPLREVVQAIGAREFEVADPGVLFNINSPQDLVQASVMLDRRSAAGGV